MYAYQAARISNETICTYAIALSDVNRSALAAGVLKSMKACIFFPSIAEITNNSQIMVEAATGTTNKGPDEAWNEVLQQMKEAFVYKKPVFSTKEIESAALAMGWVGMCETLTEDIGTIRSQFLRLYESACKRKKETRVNNDVLNSMGKQAVNSLIDSTTKQIGCNEKP
ncbi:hypothetical protein Ga0466249_002228 [Sporomusaceae bacterium BoRhaA]|nr:hypothetical protein [Pelorhabdus rhamnosifermentans]